jgi:hypothetical protein
MKKLGPGFYDDGQGGLHLVVEEMLAARGLNATYANVAKLLEVTEAFARDNPQIDVSVTKDPLPRGEGES